MSNIKSLDMGQAVLSNNKITIKKSMFGQKAFYTPTGSLIKAYSHEYDVENGKQVEKLINMPAESLNESVVEVKIKPAGIGNMRLEACVSSDSQFAVFQLSQFVDFHYRPISDVKFYEGDKAKLISSVI